MAGIGNYEKGKGFTLRSGKNPDFKQVGAKTPNLQKENVEFDNQSTMVDKETNFGPISVNSNLTRKQKATAEAEMKGIDPKNAYWYKINGKTVSKKQYLAYENNPAGDEPGKQTNNPDVYGRKASNHGRGLKTN